MDSTVIEIAEEILQSAKERKATVGLHELLWTIDAQQRIIASLDEINEALRNVEGFAIKRAGSEVYLLPSDQSEMELVTSSDLDMAMTCYQNEIDRKER